MPSMPSPGSEHRAGLRKAGGNNVGEDMAADDQEIRIANYDMNNVMHENKGNPNFDEEEIKEL